MPVAVAKTVEESLLFLIVREMLRISEQQIYLEGDEIEQLLMFKSIVQCIQEEVHFVEGRFFISLLNVIDQRLENAQANIQEIEELSFLEMVVGVYGVQFDLNQDTTETMPNVSNETSITPSFTW